MNAGMRSTLGLVAILTAAAFPASASTQQVAGTWVLSVELDAGSGDATFVLEVNGGEITGTYAGTLGNQDVTGTIESNTVKFGFSEDQVGDVTFEGTIDGDSMAGDCDYGLLGSGTFSGSRSGP